MAEVETKATEEKKSKPVLMPTRMKPYEYANQPYRIVAEEGISIEQIKSPDYWAHAAATLRPLDKLHITTDDQAWYVEAIVVQVGQNHAFIRTTVELTLEDVSSASESLATTHFVKYLGLHKHFAVVRKSDGAIIKDGMGKGEAHTFLANYLKSVG